MSTLTTEAELEAARHLLHYYGSAKGWEPGSFSSRLIQTLEAADTRNSARLLVAFPEYMVPVALLQYGVDALEQWVDETERARSTTHTTPSPRDA